MVRTVHEQPEAVDPSEEVRKIVDEALAEPAPVQPPEPVPVN